MVAGPSEVLVIADQTADPVYIAADLLSQAEHDRMASAVLLTDSMKLAQEVDREVIRQTGYLGRSDIIEASLRDFGCAIVCDDLDQCAALANEIAPEHLEIVTQEPERCYLRSKTPGCVPGGIQPGASGRLYGGAGPRPAHPAGRRGFSLPCRWTAFSKP